MVASRVDSTTSSPTCLASSARRMTSLLFKFRLSASMAGSRSSALPTPRTQVEDELRRDLEWRRRCRAAAWADHVLHW